MVDIASAAPGMLIRQAEMAPPKLAPLLMPTRNAIATSGPMKKVSGTAMAMAIGPLSPGMAPTAMPMNTPRQIISMV